MEAWVGAWVGYWDRAWVRCFVGNLSVADRDWSSVGKWVGASVGASVVGAALKM